MNGSSGRAGGASGEDAVQTLAGTTYVFLSAGTAARTRSRSDRFDSVQRFAQYSQR
jgi:hypothetical protein